MNSRSKKNKKRSAHGAPRSTTGVAREFRLAASALRVFAKRITTTGTVVTGAGGLIAATTLANTNGVSVLGDFSSLANIYSNYRVCAIKVHVQPFYPVPVWNGVAVVTVPPTIAVVPFRSGLIPAAYPAFTESSEVRFASGYKAYVFETSSKGYPDGKLWHPTNAVISTAESYGIACMGQNFVTSSASINVWLMTAEYLVEFSVEG